MQRMNIVNLKVNIGKNKYTLESYIELRLSLNKGERQTVYHETVNEWVSIGISGKFRSIEIGSSYGQIVGLLKTIDLKERMTSESELRQIISLWDRWHLNDLRSACSLQQAEFLDSPIEQLKDSCSKRHSSEWLVEEVPYYYANKLIELFGGQMHDYPLLIEFYKNAFII